VNRNFDRNRFIYFIFLLFFAHVTCITTVIAKNINKNSHKEFFIVAKNRSLLAVIYVSYDLAANRWLKTLLLL